MTLQRVFDVVRRRSLVVWAVIAVGLGVLFALRDIIPNSFVGISHVVLVTDTTARDPSVGIVDLPSIATSTVVLQRVRNALHLPTTLIDLKLDVSAAVLGRSSIMAITYRDKSAEQAIAVSNGVADELSRYYDEISTQRYDVNVDRLSTELTDESHKIRAVGQQIGAVVAHNPFVVSDESITSLSTQLATLSGERAEAYATLQGDRAVAAAMGPSPELSKASRHEILLGDPAYVAVKTVAATDAAALANVLAGYTTDFPGLAGAKAKVASDNAFASKVAARALKDANAYSLTASSTALLRAKQLATVDGDRVRVNELDALIASERASLRDFPVTGKDYDQLRSERDALQAEYTALANRRANALANRAEASSLGSVVVLDRAIKADTQLNGGRTRAAILSLILILAAAFGCAFLAESLDPRIRRAEEIERLYGIPVVARFGGK